MHILCFFSEKNQYHVKNVKKCLVFFLKYTIMIMIELLGEVCGGRNMIQSNAYDYINILDKAADASWTRENLIANNIANVDTPGYKRQDLEFEELFYLPLRKYYLANRLA